MVPEIDKPAGETPDPWETVTWAGLERAQLRDALSATPAQRLAWMEEAMLLAMRPARYWDSRRIKLNHPHPKMTERPSTIYTSALSRVTAQSSAVHDGSGSLESSSRNEGSDAPVRRFRGSRCYDPPPRTRVPGAGDAVTDFDIRKLDAGAVDAVDRLRKANGATLGTMLRETLLAYLQRGWVLVLLFEHCDMSLFFKIRFEAMFHSPNCGRTAASPSVCRRNSASFALNSRRSLRHSRSRVRLQIEKLDEQCAVELDGMRTVVQSKYGIPVHIQEALQVSNGASCGHYMRLEALCK